MGKIFDYKDVIDLEYFFYLDRDSAESSLKQRDRQIFICLDAKNSHGEKFSEKKLIYGWLETMRAKSGHVLPGLTAAKAWKIMATAVIFAGFLAGAAAASAALFYNGRAPVNVAVYFAVTVLPHWFFFLFLFSGFIWQTVKKRNPANFHIYGFYRKIFETLFRTLDKSGSRKKKAEIESAEIIIKKLSDLYGRAFFWPFFLAAQIAGLSAGIASLLVTLLKITFTDLAFGWQSTFETGHLKIYSLVGIMATPWKWMFPTGVSFPDESQIEGSRMILKEGIMSLSSPDLAAWWPFLCLCVIFYAILPRTIFFLAGISASKKSLASLDFNHADCARLLMRMRVPVFDSRADSAIQYTGNDTHAKKAELAGNSHHKALTYDLPVSESVVLVSNDILSFASTNEIRSLIQKNTGSSVSEIIFFDSEPSSQKLAIEKLRSISKNKIFPVILLMEAWQPPIIETTDFIKMAKDATDKKMPINVVLTGKPSKNPVFAAPSENDIHIWRTALEKLADPYLMTTCSGENDAE